MSDVQSSQLQPMTEKPEVSRLGVEGIYDLPQRDLSELTIPRVCSNPLESQTRIRTTLRHPVNARAFTASAEPQQIRRSKDSPSGVV